MTEINLLIAITAGMLSILSPCILPILPSFFAYITGISLKEDKSGKALILNTIAFSAGFSFTFLMFGAVIGLIGQFLLLNQITLQRIGGIIIIFLGLHLSGILPIKALLGEYKIHSIIKPGASLIRSFLIGIIFSFGWAPCYGPIIGSIFTMAASSQSFSGSILLFSFYSLGFTIPLIVFSLFIDKVNNFIKKHKSFLKYTNLFAGIILIILGFLMLTNLLSVVSNTINSLYLEYNFYNN